MDDNTTKIIKEKFDSLPESIQEAIMSSNYQDALIEVGKKHQLNVEQLGILERETTLVMMGLTPTKNFEAELTRELHVDEIKGRQMVKDINEKVFLHIRDLLKIMNTPAGEEPSVEEEPERKEKFATNNPTTQIDNDEAEVLDKAGIKIIDPEINSNITKSAPEKASPQATPQPKPNLNTLELSAGHDTVNPILTQKLSAPFKTPSTKTEHTVGNVSKPPSSYPPKGDPYRLSPDE